MEVSNSLPVKPIPVTTLEAQYSRQHIGDDWRPLGFERWQYVGALLDEMPTVAYKNGITGTGPQRYAPVGPLEADMPVHQKGDKKQ